MHLRAAVVGAVVLAVLAGCTESRPGSGGLTATPRHKGQTTPASAPSHGSSPSDSPPAGAQGGSSPSALLASCQARSSLTDPNVSATLIEESDSTVCLFFDLDTANATLEAAFQPLQSGNLWEVYWLSGLTVEETDIASCINGRVIFTHIYSPVFKAKEGSPVCPRPFTALNEATQVAKANLNPGPGRTFDIVKQ